jgi:DNA-directed RNA polymerase subunit omega
MMNITVEELMKRTKSCYGLVLAAAARANELASGDRPLIATATRKPSSIALEEVSSGKISFELGKASKAAAKEEA